MTDHSKGLLLTILGVLVITPDTLLIRLVGIGPWEMMVWRGFLQTIGIAVILILLYRGQAWSRGCAIGALGLVAAMLFVIGNLGFLFSLEYTAVANTLVILATAPFFAAIFSFLILGERIAPRTLAAIAASLFGVGIMVSDSWGSGALIGDLAAAVTAAALGFKLSILRRQKAINMVPCLALAGFFSGMIGLAVADIVPLAGVPLAAALIMGLLVMPIGGALVALGPRYITAPEVSLIFLLETALGPLWVWLVLSEVPPPLTFIGGAIIVATLFIHAWLGLKASRRAIAGVA